MEIAHDFTVAPKDIDFYFDVYSVDTASDTLGTPGTTHPVTSGIIKDVFASGTTLTSSSESWTGAGALTTLKASKTITFNRTGPFVIIPRLTKFESGKVLHYDAKVDVA